MTLSSLLALHPVVLLDGATGTELHRHGIDISEPLWSARALLAAPFMVRNIHFWYLHAGADVITANTFRTNPRALAAAGIGERWEELTIKAVEFAFEARDRYRDPRPVCVAASVAPVADCYTPSLAPSDAELEDEHGRFTETLALAGTDLLLVETMNTVREAAIAARACAATRREFAVSFVTHPDGRLLSGEPLEDAVAAVLPSAPKALMLNCVSARAMHAPLARLLACSTVTTGCYANIGTPTTDGTDIHAEVTADEFAAEAVRWHQMGARIVGGCCGTTPEIISEIHARLHPEPSTGESHP